MSEQVTTKRLTLNDFIAKAKQKEQDKFKTKGVYLESFEGEIMIQKVPMKTILDTMDRIDKDESLVNLVDVYKELIYDSVAMFKSKELQEQFEIAEPFDIVTEILELGEVLYLGNEILSLYGLNDLGQTIKN